MHNNSDKKLSGPCVQCRRKRIGCDRRKPICRNCMKSSMNDCFYYADPGRYLISAPSSKHWYSTDESLADYRQILMTKPNQFRDTNNVLNNNPALSILEEMREYNTRLQMFNRENLQQQNNDFQQSNNTHHHSNKRRHFENSNTNNNKDNDDDNMGGTENLVNGPEIFDASKEPYEIDDNDLLLKEMHFLKKRLLKLQDLTGQKLNDIDLSINLDTDTDKNKNTLLSNNPLEDHCSKIDPPITNTEYITDYEQIFDNLEKNIDKFKDVDPEFLDENEIFRVFENNFSSISKDNLIIDLPNSIFTTLNLRNRDIFLFTFINILKTIYKNQHWQLNYDNNSLNGLPIDPNRDLSFPSKTICTTIMKKYLEIVKETNILIPFLKINDLISYVDTNFTNNIVQFTTNDLNMQQLLSLGFISICLLTIYESLSSTVLILMKDEQLTTFKSLEDHIGDLLQNLHSIQLEFKRRPYCIDSVEYLQFITSIKFYNSIASFIKEDNYENNINLIDFDEDIHLALNQSLNFETKDDNKILLWNFICKNYLWRHCIKGEIPSFLLNNSNTVQSPIVDPLFILDSNLLYAQGKFIKYLQTRDGLISVEKISKDKNILQLQSDQLTSKCKSLASMVNNTVDLLIHKNISLYVSYYLLLHFEKTNQIDKFNETYEEFLKLIQNVIFFVFSNLANKNYIGYEFIFIKKSSIVMNIVCEFILGFYQRSFFAFDTTQLPIGIDNGRLNENSKKHANLWILIIRKLLMLLVDYSKNCKIINPLFEKVILKMKLIITYHEFLIQEKNKDFIKDIKLHLLDHTNILEKIDPENIQKFNDKISTISESLINKEFYSKREPLELNDLDTFGINSKNFQQVYDAFAK